MRKVKLQISAGAVLLAALIYYIGDAESLAALLIPAAVHELGHIAAIYMLGLRISGFRAELKGFCIDYRGYAGALGHAAAAFMGPAAGFLYAWAASWAGNRYGSNWLCLSAGASLLLSAFNCLPALPLDGGRITANLAIAFLGNKRGGRFAELTSLLTGAALLGAGFWLMYLGRGAALTVAAIWLLLYQESGQGIVKSRELL